MFRVFALQHDKNVPVVRYMKVKVEVESVGSGVMAGSSVNRDDIGYIPYAEVVVRRMRKDSRGLVKAKNAANLRRSEVAGRVDEKFESCAEASGGMTGSAWLFSEPVSFSRFRRRCGSSSLLASVAIGSEDVASLELTGVAGDSLAGREVEEFDVLSGLADANDEKKSPFEIEPLYSPLGEKYVL